MRVLPLLILMLILIGCNGSSDAPENTSTSARPQDPDWALPAGDHEITDTRPPTVFVASIGGFSGHSYKVEMSDNGNLLYHQNPNGFIEDGGTSEEIMVPEDMWNQLRERLNSAEVWKWRRRHVNQNIADGTV